MTFFLSFFLSFFLWRINPQWARTSSLTRFLDPTPRRTTFGKTPPDEWLTRRRDLYLTTHNTHNRQTSMHPVGFEPTISADVRPKSYALDRAVIGTAIKMTSSSSSSSIGTATLVGFDLLNYRWVFSAGRFLQSAVASGTSNPQLGGPVIRTFQLPPPGVSHVWNDAIEPQQPKVKLWARNCREFCRKWRLPRHKHDYTFILKLLRLWQYLRTSDQILGDLYAL